MQKKFGIAVEYSREHRAAPFAASLERSFSAFEFGSAKNDVMTDTLATECQGYPASCHERQSRAVAIRTLLSNANIGRRNKAA
jgi:hypothetical protein